MTEEMQNQEQPQEQSQEQPQGPEVQQDKDKQERMWAMLCHLSALVGFLGIPIGNVLGPLVIWLIKKNDFPLVDKNGKEALNFQISVLIYAIVAGLLTLVFIGFFLLIGLGIFALIMIIIASVKTNNGESFNYPITIKFLK